MAGIGGADSPDVAGLPGLTDDAIRAIESPVLLLTGNRDDLIPLDLIMRLYRTLPNAELVVCPNTDHFGAMTPQRFFPSPKSSTTSRPGTPPRAKGLSKKSTRPATAVNASPDRPPNPRRYVRLPVGSGDRPARFTAVPDASPVLGQTPKPGRGRARAARSGVVPAMSAVW